MRAAVLAPAAPPELHQHIFRPEFYTATAGTETEAAWVAKLLAGQLEQVGP